MRTVVIIAAAAVAADTRRRCIRIEIDTHTVAKIDSNRTKSAACNFIFTHHERDSIQRVK